MTLHDAFLCITALSKGGSGNSFVLHITEVANSIGILVMVQDLAQFSWSVTLHKILRARQRNVLKQAG